MSQSGVLLIHKVILMFDEIINQLKEMIMDTKLYAGVQAVAIQAQAVLCKYYSKTDESYMCRMAISESSYLWLSFCPPNLVYSDASRI